MTARRAAIAAPPVNRAAVAAAGQPARQGLPRCSVLMKTSCRIFTVAYEMRAAERCRLPWGLPSCITKLRPNPRRMSWDALSEGILRACSLLSGQLDFRKPPASRSMEKYGSRPSRQSLDNPPLWRAGAGRCGSPALPRGSHFLCSNSNIVMNPVYRDHAARTLSIAARMRSRASSRGTPDISRSS